MARPVRRFSRFLRLEELESRDVPSTTLFTDDFNRPQSQTLGTNWTTLQGSVGVSNNVSVAAASQNLVIVNSVGSADTAVQADVNVPLGHRAGLVARISGNGYYYAYLENFGGGAYAGIGAVVNGQTYHAIVQAQVLTTTGTLRFELSGPLLKVFLNDTLVTSTTNTTLTSGAVGMLHFGGNVTADNFLVEDIAPQTQALPFTDTFDTPVRGQLNTDAWVTRSGNFQLVGSQSVGAPFGSSLSTLYGVNDADVAVEANLAVLVPGHEAGLIARSGAYDSNYYYADLINYQGIFYARLFRNSGGSLTNLIQTLVTTNNFNGTGTLRFEVVGSSLRLFLNGALTLSTFDSVLTSGSVGMRTNGNAYFENFNATAIATTPATLPFSDQFTTSVNGQLSGVWGIRQGNIDIDVSFGRAIGSGNTTSIAALNGVNEANISVQADVSAATNAFSAGLIARASGGNNFYMADLYNYFGTGYVRLFRNLGGNYANIGQIPVSSTSGTLRFEVVGTSLKAFFNGTLAVAANDSTLTTGSVGMQSFSNVIFDNFTADRITVANQALPFGDDFNTSVSGQLNNTIWINQAGNVKIEQNEVTSASNGSGLATVNGVNEANVVLQADVFVPTAGKTSQLIARYSGPGSFYSADLHNYQGTTYARLYRGNGLLSQAVVNTNGTNGGLLRFEVSGSSLKLFLNGNLVVFANNSLLTSGSVGVGSIAGGNLDNFNATVLTVTPQALPFTDDFSTAANGQLNSEKWTNQSGIVRVVGVNNVASAASAEAQATVNGVNEANVVVQANVTVVSRQYVGLMARYVNDGRHYLADMFSPSDGVVNATIYRRNINGAYSALGSGSTTSTSGLMRFEVSGNSLKLFLNDNLLAFANDSSLTSGAVGMRLSNGGTVDNFNASVLTVTTQSLPFSDSFNPTSNQQLNSIAWTNQQGNIKVDAAGVAVGITPSSYSLAVLNGLSVANATVQASVDASTGQASGLVLRFTDARNYYYADLLGGSSPVARIFRVLGGSLSLLSSMPVPTSTGTLKFEAMGNALLLFFNSNPVGSAMNQTALPNGSVGIISYAGGKLDNFSAS